MAEAALNRLSRVAGAATVGVFTVSQCLYNVDGGERAVMFDTLRGGILPDVRGEGTHFLIPVIQRPVVIDVRCKAREIPPDRDERLTNGDHQNKGPVETHRGRVARVVSGIGH